MPRGDRTGPNGMGPMTGRAAGFCAGYDRPGFANPGLGGGYGMGRGMGRGFRGGFGRGYGFYQSAPVNPVPAYYGVPVNRGTPVKGQELEALKQQALNYEHGLEKIKKRIVELETE
ncbi:MAG: DUF5320 domain-containing protein [Bacteroidetes bacterium]|nr:DUF5320 domain-containing protein [Bacteroidota bacterium]MBL7136782.1 DUF5320 domain-containing protein [Candidatus Neomarinimicrobiota bacterium]